MGDAWPEEYPKIKLAILDTGIDATHDWLKLKLSKQSQRYFDFTQNNSGDTSEEDPKDSVGHGTHVAGVILQLAPHVELYVARVFDAADFEGEASEKALDRVAKVGTNILSPIDTSKKSILNSLQAIDHAVKKWEVNIISMSFGFSFKSGRRHEKMHTAISNASDNNVVMFTAASNNGNRDETPIAYPARDLRIICINASDGDGNKMFFNPPPDDEGNNFSVIGRGFPSTWPAAVPAKGSYDPEDRPGLWKYSSGTSVATPVAAALAAVIMQFGLTQGIERQPKLQSYLGIRQIFKQMSGNKTAGGFWDVRPWLVLDSKDLETSRFKIRSCLDNL
jgi:subtilisin family serine protease